MAALDNHFLLTLMSALTFLLGFVTLAVGVFILAFRVSGSEVQSLAVQTTRLVNKGLTDEMAGLVGQTSDLLNAVNQMVRTAQGVGILLILLGLLLMGGAGWFALQISQL